MSAPDFSLLGKRRYGPLFVVQFLGAFNDNVLKFALVFLANFTIYVDHPEAAEKLATLATGIFIVPYFFLSSVAGQLADSIDKGRLIRWVKASEIAIMALGLYGLWAHSIPVLLSALFLMGVHSTIFGPVKYSIIPQHLEPHEIMGGTGLIEAGTFVAILTGQLLAGVIAPWEAGLVAMLLAVVGWIASLFIPPAPPEADGGRVDWNIIRGTWQIIREANHGREIWLAILGIGWFFAAGAVVVSEFAPLASNVLKADQAVVTLFLIVFSISVAAGSLAVNRLLKGQVSARFVPVSALLMAVFLFDLWLSTSSFVPRSTPFMETPGALHVFVGLAGTAFFGGMFVVPLYAIIQVRAPKGERSRVLAAGNVINAALTVAVVAATLALLHIGLSVPELMGAIGGATLLVALGSCFLLPGTFSRRMLLGKNLPD
jgi:acyl-[acyl-carrier-protein]-phospholipid O-acyltransferase/long-chain-fatty-acid--[acyl-carrier-protein] ligase